MYGIKIKYFSLLWLLFLVCTLSSFKFSVYNSYTKENFSGWDLGNQRIGICPILTKNSWLDEKKFSYVNLTKKISRLRPDLKFDPPESVNVAILRKFAFDDVNIIYRNLFNGSILFLQNYDTLWDNINYYEYLLVIKLKEGFHIKTFDNLTKKKIKLEIELWHTSQKECFWRREIEGKCWSKKIGDEMLLEEAIIKGISLLPFALPNYDRREW